MGPPPRRNARVPAPRARLIALCGVLLAAAAPAPARADEAEDARALIRDLASVPGVSGREGKVAAAIRKAGPTWANFETDNLGNLTVTVGSGGPGLLLVAHMDEPGYLVTGVTPEGYVKLQRPARVPLPPLFDQYHLGQPLVIQARRGSVPAVAVVPSTHLWRGAASPINHAVLDEDLFVDLGARTPGEVEAAGVALLDPVVVARRFVDLAGAGLAGPALDDRAGCAALLLLLGTLEPAKIRGAVTVAFTTQGLVDGRGSARLANRFETADVLVVDAPPAGGGKGYPQPGRGPVVSVPGGAEGFSQDLYGRVVDRAARSRVALQTTASYGSAGDAAAFAGRRRVLPVGVAVGYAGTPGEVVDARDVAALAALLKSIAEGD